MAKPRMSEEGVRKSLQTWEKRQRYRYDEYRFYRDHAHTHGPEPRNLSVGERKALQKKWLDLAHEADHWVKVRRAELAWYRDQKVTPRGKVADRALAFAKMGIKEKPAGSNSGPYITGWQRHTARGASYLYHQPWCGIFAENLCAYAGVNTSPRWASVGFIEDDAKAHRNGFRGWTRNPKSVLRGDLVVLFGYGVHVEIVIAIHSTYILTVGGNTSAGSSGSQSNGGGVFLRRRSYTDVRGFALVNFPG
jgi:hypothetical protein